MENGIIKLNELKPPYNEEYLEILKAFIDYQKDFCDIGFVQRVLYFPEHGYHALTVFTSYKEDIDEARILKEALEDFPEYNYDKSELVITLEDPDDQAIDVLGDSFINTPEELFGRLFWDLYSTMKIVCVNHMNGTAEDEFNSIIEKMRQDIWDKVFADRNLPDKLGYEMH